MAASLGGRAGVPRPGSRAGRRRAPLVPARDASVPVRDPAHRSRPELHDGRRRDPRSPPPGLARAASDGLRLVRPPGGERRDQGGRPSARDHRAQHRVDPGADEDARLGDRLGARGLDARSSLLPLDAVAVHQVLRGRARVSQGGARQLVPERPDRARERAGDQRALRALRRARRVAPPHAMVLQDHELRGRAARVRPAAGRGVARAHEGDPAQLDRPLRGRRDPVQDRRTRPGAAGVHDAPRHALRRDVLRARTRAPARPGARAAVTARAGAARLRAPVGGEARRGACRCGREDRRLHRLPSDEPRQRRAHPDLGRRLRADGLRHRRNHGGARTRRA